MDAKDHQKILRDANGRLHDDEGMLLDAKGCISYNQAKIIVSHRRM